MSNYIILPGNCYINDLSPYKYYDVKIPVIDPTNNRVSAGLGLEMEVTINEDIESIWHLHRNEREISMAISTYMFLGEIEVPFVLIQLDDDPVICAAPLYVFDEKVINYMHDCILYNNATPVDLTIMVVDESDLIREHYISITNLLNWNEIFSSMRDTKNVYTEEQMLGILRSVNPEELGQLMINDIHSLF